MNFLKKRTETGSTDSDRVAGKIAAAIVRWQLALAGRIDRSINRYDKMRQRRLLWLFCIIWVGVMGINFFLSAKRPPFRKPTRDFQPTHIGQAFEMPKPAAKSNGQSDSLTIKK